MANPCKSGAGKTPCGRVRIKDGRAEPYQYGVDCALCYAFATDPATRGLWGGDPATVAETVPDQTRRVAVSSGESSPPEPCIHDAGPVPPRERERLQLGHLKQWRYCDHPERPLGRFVCPCSGCGSACRGYLADVEPERGSESNSPRAAVEPRQVFEAIGSYHTILDPRTDPVLGIVQTDPACGVVIGSYKWPSLVALQIATIRQTCGPVPILVSSDDPGSAAAVAAICARQPDVFHWPNHVKIGHTGGDVAAFFKGVIWGAARGLHVVAKLSQRFVVTRARWLQDGAAELLASGLFLASQRCRGSQRFDLRTEAVLLDVEKWNRPEVLSRILPRPYWNDSPHGLSAETIVYRLLQDVGGETFWPWSLIGEERKERRDGVLWHNANAAEEYRRLAASFGLEMDRDFHIDGWQADRSKGLYSYG